MPLPQAAADHYREQQRLTAVTIANARRLWARVDPTNLDPTWRRVLPQLAALQMAAQAAAASGSERYVDRVLAELDIDAEAAGTVVPQAFARSASNGRPLLDFLEGAASAAQGALTDGPAAAASAGATWLDMAVQTQVADASRGATSVAIAARPTVAGYVRMLNPPSCSRCTILAGKFFRWNQGFRRHPRCDCRHIPSSENTAGDLTTNPRSYFDSLAEAEQDRIFTKAGAQAVRDGADLGQVVNARSGMYLADGAALATRTGTRRGAAVRAAGRGAQRLMPERIYEIAADRQQAIDLLRRFGYLR